MEVRETLDEQFPIAIELNSGTNKFTVNAAIELKDKLLEQISKVEARAISSEPTSSPGESGVSNNSLNDRPPEVAC